MGKGGSGRNGNQSGPTGERDQKGTDEGKRRRKWGTVKKPRPFRSKKNAPFTPHPPFPPFGNPPTTLSTFGRGEESHQFLDLLLMDQRDNGIPLFQLELGAGDLNDMIPDHRR